MIALQNVTDAAARLSGQIVQTPFLQSQVLSAITGAQIYVKFENHQFTASFKERGALYRLSKLDERLRRRGVIAMSAGNHAQGVAYHGKRLGIPATIVMPAATPLTKIENTRAHGADVIVEGASLLEAYATVKRLELERGLTLIHPYDDPDVIAGQGTVALEMLTAQPDLDAIIVPVGGGGLIAGVAVAVKAVSPDTEIFGVQASSYPSMRNAFHGETTTIGGGTLAEGIAVEHPGRLTTDIARQLVSDILLVDETTLERAVALYVNVEKTVAEGAGAAGLACVLAHRERFQGRKIGLILSGGNVDPRLLASILMRELIRERRITTIRLPIEDQPGSLARVTSSLSGAGANVIEVQHTRTHLAFPAKVADIELTFETRDWKHADRVIEAVRNAGFTPTVVSV